MAKTVITEHNSLVTLKLNGKDYGTFDEFDGGETMAETGSYPPGGMQPEIAYGGRKKVGDVTIRRYYDPARDGGYYRTMQAQCGRANCVVVDQPLDEDGNTFEKASVYTGKLKSVKRSAAKSSGNAVRMLEVVVTCDGEVGSA